MELDLIKIPMVTQKDFEKDPDAVLTKAKDEHIPIVIKGNNVNDVVLISWNDYLDRFGCLYTDEELQKIEEAFEQQTYDEALASFCEDPTTYTLDEVEKELELLRF